MEGKEVWITGAGLVTPLGAGADAAWEAIRAGRCGVARHEREDFPCYGRVEGCEDPGEAPPKLASQKKFLNRGSILGLRAAREAVGAAGLEMEALPPERKSLYVAAGDFTRVGHLDFFPVMQEAAGPEWKPPDPKALNEAALHQVNPFFLLEGLPNNLFSYLSALYEIMGPNGSVSSLSSCGAQALECGDRVLRQGGADAALVVGCGSWVDPLILFELAGLGVLSKAAEGADSFRPFDRRRDGFLAGEGAAALLLETAESAAARGARPLGRVLGAGNCQEAGSGGHIPIPEEAAVRACREALADAALAPADLAFVLPHGSGTRKGDRSELRALRGLLGEAAGAVPLSGLKPYTGHMGAAGDVGELILGLRALAEGELPPTPGFERAEREFAGMDIPSAARAVAGSAFLSLSHSIGGQTSATVVGAP
ncbi:MAG: beta-ketoacyl synthase N-terminal-like domain-containing protein [bacterium]